MKRILIPGFLCLAALQSHAALVAAYTFDETSGTTAADSVRGGTGVATLQNAGATFSAGKMGNALTLNGSTGWASAINPVVTGQTQLTISAWVNVTALSTWGTIVKDWNSTATFHFGLDGNSGNDNFSNFIGAVAPGAVASSVVNLNTWYHVASTFDDATNTIYIYVNGTEVGTATSAGVLNQSLVAAGGGIMGIGGNDVGAQLLNGKIDDLAFYNTALSGSEIATIYTNGLAGVSAVPEPSTYGLIGAGSLALAAFVRRRRSVKR
jgi:hypothetical protein